MVLFFLWGVPAFLVAIPLNYALVIWAGMAKPSAYAIVLVMQVIINFFACRLFVFEVDPGLSWWKSFVIFFNGIILFRAADWVVYSVLTTPWFQLPFIGVQILNLALFGLLKFEFSRLVFEREQQTKAVVPDRSSESTPSV